LAATLVLFVVDPATSALFPPCPVRWAIGLYCPGCGSLRALHQLLHGNLGAAFRLNPLLVVFLPIAPFMIALPEVKYSRWSPWVAAMVLFAYGALRNLAGWPFSLLAPR
jgi:hypothetical protein